MHSAHSLHEWACVHVTTCRVSSQSASDPASVLPVHARCRAISFGWDPNMEARLRPCCVCYSYLKPPFTGSHIEISVLNRVCRLTIEKALSPPFKSDPSVSLLRVVICISERWYCLPIGKGLFHRLSALNEHGLKLRNRRTLGRIAVIPNCYYDECTIMLLADCF